MLHIVFEHRNQIIILDSAEPNPDLGKKMFNIQGRGGG